MPRPLKPPGLRQRRNRASTRATLKVAGVRAPQLPIRACSCGGPVEEPKRRRRRVGRPPKPKPPCSVCEGTGVLPWHHLTKAWWARLWASPMGTEYIDADLDGLFITAGLVDVFWQTGGSDPKLAGEIRQQMARFGLSPLDRRRLEWSIDRDNDEEDDRAASSAPPPQPTGTDARSILRAVK